MDLIDRQAAIDALRYKWDGTVTSVFDVINQLPPAQPERKKGKWRYVSFMTVECSECFKQIHELEYDNFCPNCGADMRGEQDDTD